MKQLSKSGILNLNKEIEEQYGIKEFFSKKDNVRIADFKHEIVVVKDNTPLFFYYEGKIVPTLKLLLENNILKRVTVDMGAVRFVTSGADIMRPGIVDLDHSIKEGEFVVIVDETHGKPLAVGKALLCGEEIFRSESGKVVKNIHYVGDSLWKMGDQ
ncbi:DUF1947 domain-containing protein [Candidatus Woesearchaeota archaeon]|nr:MAG: DUF1947 domain-containing protein [Candidatus Woesearchaeota archaeon]